MFVIYINNLADREMELPPDSGACHLAEQRAREVGFYLAQALSGHGYFKPYLRRFKKSGEEICYCCDFPVDNAEHALFVCAKWGVARENMVGDEAIRSLIHSI